MNNLIHNTSIIDGNLQIGDRTKIWHFCHISKDVKIGNDCILGQNVFIDEGIKIGNNVKIQNNVSIYKGVVIEDNVFLGPSCVFTNVKNPRSEIPRRHLCEITIVHKGATIGANATIICGNELGYYCFIAAGAIVTRDIGNYELIIGKPSMNYMYMSRHGHRLCFKYQYNGEYDGAYDGKYKAICPESLYNYVLDSSPGKFEVKCLHLDENDTLPS